MYRQVEQWGNLKPERKIAMAIEMSDTCMQICATGIKMNNPNINERLLLKELRKRIEWMKRHRDEKRRVSIVWKRSGI